MAPTSAANTREPRYAAVKALLYRRYHGVIPITDAMVRLVPDGLGADNTGGSPQPITLVYRPARVVANRRFEYRDGRLTEAAP